MPRLAPLRKRASDPPTRPPHVALALLLALLLAVLTIGGLGEPAPPDAPAAPTPPAGTPSREPPDIFAPRSWLPTPPPADSTAAAPPPVAAPALPPLPFRLVGRIREPGQAPVYLLADGNRVHDVRAGEAVGEDYVLLGEDGDDLVFRHRPSGHEQRLALDGAAP